MHMKRWKNKLFNIFFIFVFFVVLIFNIHFNGYKNFLMFNIGNVITWLIAIYITYLLTQKRLDDRNLINKYDNVLKIIIQTVSDERFIKCKKGEDVDFVGVQKEYVSNCITVLEKINCTDTIKTKINDIRKEFTTYEEIFDQHKSNIQKLHDNETLFVKKINLIKKYCLEVQIELYKKEYLQI